MFSGRPPRPEYITKIVVSAFSALSYGRPRPDRPGTSFDLQNGAGFGVKINLKVFPASSEEVPKMGPDFDHILCCFLVILGPLFGP